MGLMDAPRGMRLHIGIFGRRNVGKSSLLNAITRQDVSIVSDFAGTTTDPVEKPMELLPLGPVLFIDTAGIDDVGVLGELRARRTTQVFDRTDLGVLVTEAGSWGEYEDGILDEFLERKAPVVVVFNKADLVSKPAPVKRLQDLKITPVLTAASEGRGVLDFRQALLDNAPPDFIDNPTILGDLVNSGDLAILVVPIDKEAPRGRLILPQVQSIRDLMDSDAMALVVKERELKNAIDRLNRPPRLVVTDSQAFLKVAADTPPDVPLTSFSILFSRFKGDLTSQVEGTLAVDDLKSGANILIAEACSHHPIAEDIGRVKIPRWLTQYVGGKLNIEHMQGHDFPDDLSRWDLVIHCGACTFNRRAMLGRILRCRQQGVPITNYGLVIAFSLGIFERALQPFPAALEAMRAAQAREGGRDPLRRHTVGPPRLRGPHGLKRGRRRPLLMAGRPQAAPALGVADALAHDAVEHWLRETDEARLETLWAAADEARHRYVGDEVHLRGLVEVSNYCVRGCTYCGIRAGNRGVERYRVSADVVLACAHQAEELGYGTLVMQSGEDYGIETEWLASILRRISAETGLAAITLSLGERPDHDLAAWRDAGADRYLLRFETSDDALYRRIHPDLPGKVSDRMAILRRLQELGYEAGTGIMVGIPGQTHASIAADIELFRGMAMDMIGIGPYLPHPATPLGQESARRQAEDDWPADQAPNSELMTCKVLALTRLARPDANLPATTALSLVNKTGGRAHGLQRGANVVMPNLTPLEDRARYEIYPEKAAVHETAEAINVGIVDLLAALGRTMGTGAGGRRRPSPSCGPARR